MAVILDTGPLVAFLHSGDPYHAQATRLMAEIRSGRHGRLLSTDLVMVETLNFLRNRPGRQEISRNVWALYGGARSPFAWLVTDAQALEKAARLHLDRFERGLSMTDATLVIHAQQIGASVATFDDQFKGLVPTLA